MSVSRWVSFQLIHAAIPEAARDGELGMLPLRNTPTAKSQCMEVKGVTGDVQLGETAAIVDARAVPATTAAQVNSASPGGGKWQQHANQPGSAEHEVRGGGSVKP